MHRYMLLSQYSDKGMCTRSKRHGLPLGIHAAATYWTEISVKNLFMSLPRIIGINIIHKSEDFFNEILGMERFFKEKLIYGLPWIGNDSHGKHVYFPLNTCLLVSTLNTQMYEIQDLLEKYMWKGWKNDNTTNFRNGFPILGCADYVWLIDKKWRTKHSSNTSNVKCI